MKSMLDYAAFERFPDDGRRREIVGGELYVTPPPTTTHQDAVSAILVAFKEYAAGSGGWAYAAPVGLFFGPHDVVQSDVTYIGSDRLHIIEQRELRGAPTIVVEVLSPSTRKTDYGRKRRLYATYGVPEYWIVDPVARVVDVLNAPENDDYVRSEHFTRGLLRSSAAPGLELALERVFARPPKA